MDKDQETLKPEQISEVLNFDPFKAKESEPAKEEQPAAAAEGEKAKDEPKQEPEQAEQPVVEAAKPAAKPKVEAKKPEPKAEPKPAENPELALLRQQMQSMSAELSTLRSAAKTTDEPKKPADPLAPPSYDMHIPDEFMTLMESENVADRKRALAGLVKATAVTVHAQVARQVRDYIESQVPTMLHADTAQRTAQQQVYQDFYSRHPELDKDALRPVVINEAMKLATELGVQQWTPAFRDALGVRVRQVLAGVLPAAPARPAQRPATLTRVAARPANSGGDPSQEITDVLFG